MIRRTRMTLAILDSVEENLAPPFLGFVGVMCCVGTSLGKAVNVFCDIFLPATFCGSTPGENRSQKGQHLGTGSENKCGWFRRCFSHGQKPVRGNSLPMLWPSRLREGLSLCGYTATAKRSRVLQGPIHCGLTSSMRRRFVSC